MKTLMDKVWDAYWQPEPPGTDAALARVVSMVLDHAAGVAEDHAHGFERKLNPASRRAPISDHDVAVFESAASAAIEIRDAIRHERSYAVGTM